MILQDLFKEYGYSNIEDDIDKPLEKESELVLIDINNALDYLELPYQRKALELYLTEYGDLL